MQAKTAVRPRSKTKQTKPKGQGGIKLVQSAWLQLDFKWLWVVLITGVSLYYLLPRISDLNLSVATLQSADIHWLFSAVVATAATYAMSTFVVIGSTDLSLRYGKTLVLQLAATVLSRVTPKGIGGAALTEQYLEKNGLSRTEAAVSMTFIYGSGMIMHALLLAATTYIVDFQKNPLWSIDPVYIVLSVIALICLGTMAVFLPRARRLLGIWYHQFTKGLRRGIDKPIKLIQLSTGSAGITLSYTLALYFSLAAFGSTASFVLVLFIYLAGSAIAAPAPTPSGLGAIEAALVVGLNAAGTPLEQAVAGVLMFRLLTFWLPILPGLLALIYINRYVFSTGSGRSRGRGF